MASAEVPTNAVPLAFPDFGPPNPSVHKDAKTAQSAPDSTRRHSLPTQFLPSNLWSKNISSASLVESEEAARGEHILDEASVAHRITALRQLNGGTGRGHRYAKSTGAKSSTFSQPVIVRTYSGTVRPPSRQRNVVTVKKEIGNRSKMANKAELKLPPVEAFTFKGIMDEIRHGVAEDLERIAEICARSKYSLSNQYEVHMPPHGRGEPYLRMVEHGSIPHTNIGGPTLQAIGSDDEQSRPPGRVPRGHRRTRSAAYGTLETIMSSSRSSEEDNSKKKSAAELAEEVRGRLGRNGTGSTTQSDAQVDISKGQNGSSPPARHKRSKSASFAAIVIDQAHNVNEEVKPSMLPSVSLLSEPARPQTSTTANLEVSPPFEWKRSFSSPLQETTRKPSNRRRESDMRNQTSGVVALPTILESISSWLPWTKSPDDTEVNAEGSLRELLKATDSDKKGKGPSRYG